MARSRTLILAAVGAMAFSVFLIPSAGSDRDFSRMEAELKRLDSICAPDDASRQCDDLEMLRAWLLEEKLKEFGDDGLKMSDLYRISGLEARIRELEIDWRDLPELSHVLREPELAEKLRDKTGRGEFFVKDLEDQGWGTALRVLPLTQHHITALELTSEQLEELITKVRGAQGQPSKEKKR